MKRLFMLVSTFSLLLMQIMTVHPSAAMPAAASCEISGAIITDTTWSPQQCDPYIVIGNIQIKKGVTLTIKPGTTLRFNQGVGLQVEGTLVARGTDDKRIQFTSNQAAPAPGDWSSIRFEDSATDAVFEADKTYMGGSALQYAVIEYAGQADFVEPALDISAAIPYLDHVIVENSNHIGIQANNTGIYLTNSVISSSDSTGIRMDGTHLKVIMSGNTFENNAEDAVFINGSDKVDITVAQNVVRKNRVGLRLSNCTDGKVTIEGNLITDNDNSGIQFSGRAVNVTMLGNDILNNAALAGGEVLVEGQIALRLNDNNIVANNAIQPGVNAAYQPNAFSSGGGITTQSLDATNNYWGATDKAAIEALIEHYNDDTGLHRVVYEPFRTEAVAIPEPKPAPVLIGSDSTGQAGSLFTFDGGDFPPNQTVTVIIEGQKLGDIQTDSDGNFQFSIASEKANADTYVITASVTAELSASAVLMIDPNQPQRKQETRGVRQWQIPAARPAAGSADTPCDAPSIVRSPTTLSASTCNPYVAENGMLVIDGAILTIEPGTTIKFGLHAMIEIQDGQLIAIGSAEQPISLTSSAASPAPGDWQGIIFGNRSMGSPDEKHPDGLKLHHAVIEYAGGTDKAGGTHEWRPGPAALYLMMPLAVNAPPIEIADAVFRSNNGFAMLYQQAGSLRITNTTIENNSMGGLACQGGVYSLELSGNVIRANGGPALIFEGGAHPYASTDRSPIVIANNRIYGNRVTRDAVVSFEGYGLQDSAVMEITQNLIYNNAGTAALKVVQLEGFSGGGGYFADLTNNTIANNSGIGLDLYLMKGRITFAENSVFGNRVDEQSLGLVLNNPFDVDVANNYWGVNSEREVEEQVLHRIDETKRGMVFFSPFLTTPPAAAPPLPADALSAEDVVSSLLQPTALTTPTLQAEPTAPALTPQSESAIIPTSLVEESPVPTLPGGDLAPTVIAAAPTPAAAQPGENNAGGTIVETSGPSTYLAWVYWGLLVVLGLLWVVEAVTRRRHIGDAITAALASGKWRVQQMQLTGERGSIEKDLTQVTVELGRLAWSKRIQDLAYADLFTRLIDLDQQRIDTSTALAALDTQIQQATTAANHVKVGYASRITGVQEQKKAVIARHNQAHSATQTAEKQLGKIHAQQKQSSSEIQTMRQRLDQGQVSSAPDRDTQAAALTSGITALEQTLANLAGLEPAAQAELTRLQAEQASIAVEIAAFDQQLAQLQSDQQQELAPINRHREELQGQRQQTNDSVTKLTAQIDASMSELGMQVSKVRPQDPALADSYARIDQLQQRLTEISGKITILNAYQQGLDRGSLRTFYLLLVALVGTIGVIVMAVVWI